MAVVRCSSLPDYPAPLVTTLTIRISLGGDNISALDKGHMLTCSSLDLYRNDQNHKLLGCLPEDAENICAELNIRVYWNVTQLHI